eukprot:CAMPEP_0113958966 /NCGR_PEP_ID=MMETSP0011_2-20120614/3852_1 /TAXON_ID=101924 /ORGANISM="Rhodosorus marinus" /LENGTH=346 /DNA_ID=CAMNT_0000970165 /DNA_START=147 /DNA_END=1187 /DNA_ORIENTATION=- /assembly_acc=CAM_ASM_000156
MDLAFGKQSCKMGRIVFAWVFVLCVVGLALGWRTPELDECGESGPAETFLMGFLGHSGSSAVMSQLYLHSDLHVPWPLEPMQKYIRSPEEGAKWTEDFFLTGKGMGLVPGFKLRPGHIDESVEVWSELIRKYNTRFIRQDRTDLLKGAIGLYSIRARFDRSAVAGLDKGEGETHCALHPEQCYFDIENVRFFAYLMHMVKDGVRQLDDFADLLPWKCQLNVTYEEYMHDKDATMKRIYDFIGVDYQEHESSFEKALSDNPCETVTNYQQVCAQLWGCEEFQPFLDNEEQGCYCLDKEYPRNAELCDVDALISSGTVLCQRRQENGTMKLFACTGEEIENKTKRRDT